MLTLTQPQIIQEIHERYLAAGRPLMAMDVAWRLGDALDMPAMFDVYRRALELSGKSLWIWRLAYNERDLEGWVTAGKPAFQPAGSFLEADFDSANAYDYQFLALDTVTSGDFSLEAQVQVEKDEVGFAGLVFGKKSDTTFHALILYPPHDSHGGGEVIEQPAFVDLTTFYSSDSFRIWRHVPVKSRTEEGASSAGEWHEVRLDVVGTDVDVWIDGEFSSTQSFPDREVLRGARFAIEHEALEARRVHGAVDAPAGGQHQQPAAPVQDEHRDGRERHEQHARGQRAHAGIQELAQGLQVRGLPGDDAPGGVLLVEFQAQPLGVAEDPDSEIQQHRLAEPGRGRHVQGGQAGCGSGRGKVRDAGKHQGKAVAGAQGRQGVVDPEGDQRRSGHAGGLGQHDGADRQPETGLHGADQGAQKGQRAPPDGLAFVLAEVGIVLVGRAERCAAHREISSDWSSRTDNSESRSRGSVSRLAIT